MTISTETILKELTKKLENKEIKFFFIDKKVSKDKKRECLLKAPCIKIVKIGELKEVGQDKTLFAKEYDPNWNKRPEIIEDTTCPACKKMTTTHDNPIITKDGQTWHRKCHMLKGTISSTTWNGEIGQNDEE